MGALSVRIGAACTLFVAAGGIALAAGDYGNLEVLDTVEIEMWAGPAETAALLSPDGSRVLNFGTREVCLYAPSQTGPWAKVSCTDKNADNRALGPEDIQWSPDGTRVLMPTFRRAFQNFQDTDIEVFDVQALAVSNLTDDGVDGSVMRATPRPADLDISPRWVNDGTVAFLRYDLPVEGIGGRVGPYLMAIDATGGEPRVLTKPLVADNALVYAFAVSRDAGEYAYAIDDRDSEKVAGIYIVDTTDNLPRRIAAMADVGKPPDGLAFSADGKFLLLLGPGEDPMRSDARVIDLATGEVVRVDAVQNVTGVAWSPTGSALVYITQDRDDPAMPGGLFLSGAPGALGRLLIGGAFMTPACCGRQPFTWAANNTLILGQIANGGNTVLYVRLGE